METISFDHADSFFVHAGNKCDLDQLREVRKEEALMLARQHNMLEVLETSAKDNTNVDEAFLKIAKVFLLMDFTSFCLVLYHAYFWKVIHIYVNGFDPFL